jgi:pimeloyl-ACP methyl ester carboxylesterase
LAGGALLCGATVASAALGVDDQILGVGAIEFRRCGPEPRYCASVERPLDPDGRVTGSVHVHVEFYPHRDRRPAGGTLVAVEGGPGFPTTESRATYLALFDPLRGTRDVVLMDGRGTGRSDAIDCEPLQNDAAITEENMGECGRWLGERAPFFGTAAAMDDLAFILDRMGAGAIDLYGDSYGSFAAQVFAWRHADRVRSLVLDGPDPLHAPDAAWQPNYAPAMQRKFALACERSPGCAAQGGTLRRTGEVLARLRARPYDADAFDADGRPVRIRADAAALARVMFGSAPSIASLRELDAAQRAFLAGDELPLLRLMAESLEATDSRDPRHDPAVFSLGQAAAVTCQDSEQIFDMTLAPEARRRQRDALVQERAARTPDLYAPFTMAEYRGMPLDYTYLDECVLWPAPDASHPAQALYPPGAAAPTAPVLVINGEFDNITPPADGRAVAAAYPHARSLRVRSGLHVNAKPGTRSTCAMRVARHFIEALDPGREECALEVPSFQLVPAFGRRLQDYSPAEAMDANRAGPDELRAVRVAALAVGDVLGRLESSLGGSGRGLRGGAFRTIGKGRLADSVLLQLDGLRFSDDLAVSGTLEWNPAGNEGRAALRLDGPAGVHGELSLRWRDQDATSAFVPVTGTLDGRNVRARVPLP